MTASSGEVVVASRVPVVILKTLEDSGRGGKCGFNGCGARRGRVRRQPARGRREVAPVALQLRQQPLAPAAGLFKEVCAVRLLHPVGLYNKKNGPGSVCRAR